MVIKKGRNIQKKKDVCYLYDYDDKIIEITVIKQTGTCHAGHKKGDKFYCTDHKTPEGMCGWAFASIFPYITGIAHGAEFPWEPKDKRHLATGCCSDPINPVVFEIKVKENKISGIIPPLITPINSQGNVDEKSVKNLIEYVGKYSSALMPTLSSGEGWALSKKQFEDMIKFTLKYSKDLPVYAGVEFKSTSEVIKYGLLAKKLGVDAIVITTPFKKNISQKSIYEHFKIINEQVKSPIFIYNEKAISGNEISYDTIEKICKLGSIIGIKEASNNPNFTNKLIKNMSIPVFQGWEHLCFESKNVAGYVLPLCNLEPKLCFEMLKKPTKMAQDKINQSCKKYNLVGDDWYAYLKKELKRRKIILTDKVIK
jgi:4-hydroxy-tetrahydrodipicolinate synthase|tara:strand:- start:2607 stop:3713 length:1107 start_codon:yes stop_codon:yes gene_type:complete